MAKTSALNYCSSGAEVTVGQPKQREGTISAKRATTLKTRVAQLAGEPALHFFELAQLLTELHEVNPGALAGLPTVSGIKRRRMYYLLRAGELIRDQRISKKQAENIGWTKLQIIARHLNASGEVSSLDFGELVKIADDYKARDLPMALRGRRVVPRRAVQFYLNIGARAELSEALIQFGAKKKGRRMKGKEAALIRLIRAATGGEPPGS